MEYFRTKGYREDYTNILKSVLLLSKKMEEITEELRLVRQTLPSSQQVDAFNMSIQALTSSVESLSSQLYMTKTNNQTT